MFDYDPTCAQVAHYAARARAYYLRARAELQDARCHQVLGDTHLMIGHLQAARWMRGAARDNRRSARVLLERMFK